MVLPIFCIIVELLNSIDFIFSFQGAMLGNPKLDTYPRSIKASKIQFGISDCRLGTVDSNRACPRPPTQFPLFLTPQWLEVAYINQCFFHVADIEFLCLGFASK